MDTIDCVLNGKAFPLTPCHFHQSYDKIVWEFMLWCQVFCTSTFKDYRVLYHDYRIRPHWNVSIFKRPCSNNRRLTQELSDYGYVLTSISEGVLLLKIIIFINMIKNHNHEHKPLSFGWIDKISWKIQSCSQELCNNGLSQGCRWKRDNENRRSENTNKKTLNRLNLVRTLASMSS